MIAKGADIRIVRKILRNNDIKTTLRYARSAIKRSVRLMKNFDVYNV